MDGRFRRKKKLKVSEKFEKLGKVTFSRLLYSDVFFEVKRLNPNIPNPALAQFHNSRQPKYRGICESLQEEHG